MASAAGQYFIGGSQLLHLNNGASPTTQELNSAGDKIGCVFVAPDGSQAITKIGVYCTAITGSAPTMRVVIEGYNATGGVPDGSDAGGGSPTATTFTPVAGTYHEITLTNAFTPTEGTIYAVVLEYDSGTIDGSNNSTFVRSYSTARIPGNPYCVSDTAGSWAKVASVHPAITPVYASGLIVPGTEIITAGSATALGSGSTPDEFGVKWVPDDSGTCIGATIHGRWALAAADWDVILYDSGDSVLASVSIDGEAVAATGTNQMMTISWEGILVTAASTYRLVAKPTTANAIRVFGVTFVNSAHRASYAGAALVGTERTDAGAWTDDTSEIRTIGPIMSDIAAGGAGGLLVHPGTSGGARG